MHQKTRECERYIRDVTIDENLTRVRRVVTDKRIAEIASDDGDRILVAENTVVTFLAQK